MKKAISYLMILMMFSFVSVSFYNEANAQFPSPTPACCVGGCPVGQACIGCACVPTAPTCPPPQMLCGMSGCCFGACCTVPGANPDLCAVNPACATPTLSNPVCGNGIREGTEVCDGTDNCATGCSPDCNFCPLPSPSPTGVVCEGAMTLCYPPMICCPTYSGAEYCGNIPCPTPSPPPMGGMASLMARQEFDENNSDEGDE